MTEKEVRSYLLWLLARRDYSRAALELKLKKRGLEKAAVRETLDKLRDEGIFKEENYARVRTRQLARRGLGAYAIRAKLRMEKCIPDQAHFSEAYETLNSSPEEQLKILIEKTLKRWSRGRLAQKSDPKEISQRLVKSLAPKGHSAHSILKVYKELRSEIS